MKTVNKVRVQALKDEIRHLQKLLRNAQNKCEHKNGNYMYAANTGGYAGPDYDTYWINCQCEDCGFQWTVHSDDKDDDGYSEIPRRKEWHKTVKDNRI
jgi:hypothetical protein